MLVFFGGGAAAYVYVTRQRKKKKKAEAMSEYNTAVKQQMEEAQRKRTRNQHGGTAIDRNISSHVQIIYDPCENDGVHEDAVQTPHDNPSHFFAFDFFAITISLGRLAVVLLLFVCSRRELKGSI